MVSETVPHTLALVDADAALAADAQAAFGALGCDLTAFGDGDDFLVSERPYAFGFFVVGLDAPGVGGLDLVRLLRRRSNVGIVALAPSQRAGHGLALALDAGADMVLGKPMAPDDLVAAVRAVYRRVATLDTGRPWRLDSGRGELLSPAGVTVALSPTDVAVLGCFVAARDATVTAATLCARLGRPHAKDAENWLHATIYRLRRRLERATNTMVPLQSVPRVGYVFRADLHAAVRDANAADAPSVLAFRRRRAVSSA